MKETLINLFRNLAITAAIVTLSIFITKSPFSTTTIIIGLVGLSLDIKEFFKDKSKAKK